MKKYLQYYRFIIIDIFCTISCKAGCTSDGNTINCNCNFKVVADSVTFNEKGELIFVNSKFNFEYEAKEFQSYTKTNTEMEELDSSKLKDPTKNSIYLYDLKVGYSPIGYCCFKYGNNIYVLKEDQGRYLLPIAEKENNSFKEKIDWVCVIGSDKDEKTQKQNYFLLKEKFEDNKKNALVLDDFISKNKFKRKTEKMEVTIIDEEKQKENLNNNNGTISINNIQINIGTINNISQTKNMTQQISIVKK